MAVNTVYAKTWRQGTLDGNGAWVNEKTGNAQGVFGIRSGAETAQRGCLRKKTKHRWEYEAYRRNPEISEGHTAHRGVTAPGERCERSGNRLRREGASGG